MPEAYRIASSPPLTSVSVGAPTNIIKTEDGVTSNTSNTSPSPSASSQKHRRRNRRRASAPPQMAGLPLFGGTCRDWMADPTISSTDEQKNHAFNKQMGSSPMRAYQKALGGQFGACETSDKKSETPDSPNSFDHVGDSSFQRDVQHLVREYQRTTSTDSCAGFDQIEAEVDQLKEDIKRLKEQESWQRTELRDCATVHTDCRPGSAVVRVSGEISAAARLFEQHQRACHSSYETSQTSSTTQIVPNQSDFPALTEPSEPAEKTVDQIDGGRHRKTFYADAVNNGLPRSSLDLSDSTCTMSSPPAVSSACMADVPLDCEIETLLPAIEGCKNHDRRSISSTSPTYPNAAVIAHSSLASRQTVAMDGVVQPAKSIPRFAQLTKSHARRTGEKLHKDLPLSPSPISPSESPSKNDHRTMCQGRIEACSARKRASLPNKWLDPVDHKRENMHRKSGAKHGARSPSCNESNSSPIDIHFRWSADSRETLKESHECDHNRPNPKGRKYEVPSLSLDARTSYMAPTEATTQRNIANRRDGSMRLESTQRVRTKANMHSAAACQPVTKSGVTAQRLASKSRPDTRSMSKANIGLSVIPIFDQQQAKVVNKKHRLARHDAGQRISGKIYPSRTSMLHGNLAHKSTKIPRPSSRIKHVTLQSVDEDTAGHSSTAATITSLMSGLNTTLQRRTSHRDIIAPIVERLDSRGLLSKSPPADVFTQRWHSSRAGMKSGRQSSPASNGFGEQRWSDGGSDSYAPSDGSVAVILGSQADTFRASFSHTGHNLPDLPPIVVNERPRTPPKCQDGLVIEQDNDQRFARNLSHTASLRLRATAKEFLPALRPQEHVGDVHQNDDYRDLGYVRDEIWTSMSPEKRKSIKEQRRFYRGEHGFSPSSRWLNVSSRMMTMPHFRESPPRWLTHGDVASSDTASGNATMSPMTMVYHEGTRSDTAYINDGPLWNGGTGHQSSTHLGGAPIPTVLPSMVNSPSSSTSSPLQPQCKDHRWAIGSVTSPVPYSWSGGDGREVCFVGYGPHAERDGNKTLNFKFLGSSLHIVPGTTQPVHTWKDGFSDQFGLSSDGRWSKKSMPCVGSISPCGNVEIMQAAEIMPFAGRLAGLCQNCCAH